MLGMALLKPPTASTELPKIPTVKAHNDEMLSQGCSWLVSVVLGLEHRQSPCCSHDHPLMPGLWGYVGIYRQALLSSRLGRPRCFGSWWGQSSPLCCWRLHHPSTSWRCSQTRVPGARPRTSPRSWATTVVRPSPSRTGGILTERGRTGLPACSFLPSPGHPAQRPLLPQGMSGTVLQLQRPQHLPTVYRVPGTL